MTLKQLFGEDITKFLIVVFAGADGLEGHTHGRCSMNDSVQLVTAARV